VTENVVYSYDPDVRPAIHYHSIPSSCAGGAGTLGEARSSYRSQLMRLLNVNRDELPAVIEHLEAVVAGTWVRTRVGAVHRDRFSDRMFLQTLMSPGLAQDELRSDLDRASGRGLRPVVVIVEPGDTLGSVLDQMTPHDALWVAYPDDENVVGWVVIYGPDARGGGDITTTVDIKDLRGMPIEAFARTFAANTPVWPHPQLRAG
jgi:hypothetical protein